MANDALEPGLNSAQALHLLTSARYADKLFSDIESVLFASKSKSPFREYKNELPPGQIRVIEDYLAKIRVQLVKSLESQGVTLPAPQIESIHSIRTTLAFVKIAFEDCRPGKMRGYGDLSESKAREINGLVDEMSAAVQKLDIYLAQGLAQDFEARLGRLEQVGNDIGIVRHLQQIIADHGLVEDRPMLSMIIERLESPNFEIAVFGRVSSGKSSLLNSIVQTEVLPVGVNPITSVPTRLVFGETARLKIWYADRNPEQLEIDKLAEFVTEEHNPANCKHVERVVAEIPSPRLRQGIIFVDTPGLGSLATSGAAETLAYLPRCDLGIVLVDAASTLTDEDLSTIRLLYEAGVPVSVLLSKSDLVSEPDRKQAIVYISRQIKEQLGLDIPVHPVSVRSSGIHLLERWLDREIFPLYERHRQLMEESLHRKIGALRESVEAALRTQLEISANKSVPIDVDFPGIETRLRNAAGRFADARKTCMEMSREIENFAAPGIAGAASRLVKEWTHRNLISADRVVQDTLTDIAAAQASLVAGVVADVARELIGTLQDTARDLGLNHESDETDLSTVINDLPRLDLGTWAVKIAPTFRLKFSNRMEIRRVERSLREQIGGLLKQAFYNFGRMLDAWARRTLDELQLRFATRADKYRAHMLRLSDGHAISDARQTSLRRDLDELLRSQSSTGTESATAS